MSTDKRTPRQQAEHLLELASAEADPAIKNALIEASLMYFRKDTESHDFNARFERYMDNIRMARIEPWGAELNPDSITRDVNDVDDILAKNVLKDLEQRGISHIRITAQSPEDYVVRSLAKFIGPLTQSQNDFQGGIKLVEPKVGGQANSGDTAADLGLHVDGTQHEETPAVLIFHYIAGAKVGANSVFVDTAKALLDIDEERRYEILTNLARHDAATCSKKGMTHTGPIIYFSPTGSLVCRLRFDEVMKVKEECRGDYEFLREKFNDERFTMEFRPREGDIIVFDNWRVMHARDEVHGQKVRLHWRAWVSTLKSTLQPHYYLGIRPIPLEVAHQIKSANAA